MLKNIPKIVSPELLKTLCEMGHGDEIVIVDGNFPAEKFGKRERAKTAFSVIATGEEAVYANIILKKGVIK